LTEHSVDGATLAVNPGAELLEAATAALRLLDRIDAHAPEGLAFGGEAKVRRALQQAIRRARAVVDRPIAPDPQDYRNEADYEVAVAVHEEEKRLGCAMSGRERKAFVLGFRGGRLR
jgi:hypothetical protein